MAVCAAKRGRGSRGSRERKQLQGSRAGGGARACTAMLAANAAAEGTFSSACAPAPSDQRPPPNREAAPIFGTSAQRPAPRLWLSAPGAAGTGLHRRGRAPRGPSALRRAGTAPPLSGGRAAAGGGATWTQVPAKGASTMSRRRAWPWGVMRAAPRGRGPPAFGGLVGVGGLGGLCAPRRAGTMERGARLGVCGLGSRLLPHPQHL